MIEYDQSYFETVDGVTHPAGFSFYGRHSLVCLSDPDCQGEVFKTQHYKFYRQYRDYLDNKKVLELGCAKGFFVEDMREYGVDCIGVDGSEWAISQANEHCQRQDVREWLPTLQDEAYDTVIGLRFLPCLTDEEIADLLPHIRRVAANRIFVVDDQGFYESLGLHELTLPGEEVTVLEKLKLYYNVKTLEDWQELMDGCIVESISDDKWGFK